MTRTLALGQGQVGFGFPAPAPLLNANDRLHWSVRNRRTQAWRNAAKTYGRAAVGPRIIRYDRAAIDVTFSLLDRRRRDRANLAPTVKAIVDGLVLGHGRVQGLGLLEDDDDAHLDGPHMHIAEDLAHGMVPWVDVVVTALPPLAPADPAGVAGG